MNKLVLCQLIPQLDKGQNIQRFKKKIIMQWNTNYRVEFLIPNILLRCKSIIVYGECVVAKLDMIYLQQCTVKYKLEDGISNCENVDSSKIIPNPSPHI